jgi:SRSO17 transposase
MTSPTFENLHVIASGWILSCSKRTVTGIIQRAGAVGTKDHSVFHRFFSRASWSLDEVSRVLLGLLLEFVPADEVVYLAVDDTLCRKKGLNIFGTCMHHDPLISSRKFRLVNWGHDWVVVGIILRFPFAPKTYWCLPFAFRLYISRKRPKSQRWKRGKRIHKTRPQLAAEIINNIASWYPERRFHVFGDSAYGGESVVKQLPENFHLTSRIVLNARLYDDPKPQKGRGRRRKKGKDLPTPQAVANDRTKKWKTAKFDLYGKKRTLQFKKHSGLWKSSGYRRINITIVRDPSGVTGDQAFYTTDLSMKPLDTLTRYAARWSIETAFQNAKSHFGFEAPQNRKKRAVERTAPMGMVFYSLVVVWFAHGGHQRCKFPNRPWYRWKSTASFLDMIVTIQRESLREHFSGDPTLKGGVAEIIRLFDQAFRPTG